MTPEQRPTANRARRLSPSTRKAVLVVHIGAAVSWLGIDIVLGVFVLRATVSTDPTVAAVSYQALQIFAGWTLIPAGLLALASGLALGWGTRFGVLRYWWVVAKLAITVVLIALVPIGLQPTVAEAAEYGRRLMTDRTAGDPPRNLYFPPIVSPTALIAALLLAVYKPWGRIRKRHSTSPTA